MSAPQQFLVCDDENHADLVDLMVVERLRDEEGSHGSSWSGVFTDGTRFGILWADPVSALFGDLIADGEEVAEEVIDEDGISNWQPLPPPEPEEIP